MLVGETLELRPLAAEDFEAVYKAASDPAIWEQHPYKDRYKREVFQDYFNTGIQSGGCLKVIDRATGDVIGCSRYYEFNPSASSVIIGFTFLARKYWGGKYNGEMKKLMLDHAFKFVKTVLFHVDQSNIRSQKAMEKIGGVKRGLVERTYPRLPPKMMVEYVIENSLPLR